MTEVDGEWNSDTQVARIDGEIVIRTGNKLRIFTWSEKSWEFSLVLTVDGKVLTRFDAGFEIPNGG